MTEFTVEIQSRPFSGTDDWAATAISKAQAELDAAREVRGAGVDAFRRDAPADPALPMWRISITLTIEAETLARAYKPAAEAFMLAMAAAGVDGRDAGTLVTWRAGDSRLKHTDVEVVEGYNAVARCLDGL
jgi:hypothetical protein